jgi:hypothetical protein
MAEAKKSTAKKTYRTARGAEGKKCSVEGCKRPYRAKSYCFFHYKKWRQGELPHSRYRTCSKPECKAKAAQGKEGLCEKHFAEVYKKADAAAA